MTRPDTARRRVVVVGGGLAGITAAIDLADAGLDVVLLEARPRLGGAASSYQRGEMTIDNGQHVILRCCDAYRGLLARLGVTAQVAFQDRFDVTVLGPGGPARLRRSGMPSPLHMTRALTTYRLLPLGARLAVGRAALAMRFLDQADPALDQQRLGDWLAARGQGELARRRLWDLFIVSALNIAGDDASLALAATVIKTALLGAKDAADIGVATVPLGDLHDKAPTTLLSKLGVQVHTGAKVTAIRPAPDGGFELDLTRNEDLEPDGEESGRGAAWTDERGSAATERGGKAAPQGAPTPGGSGGSPPRVSTAPRQSGGSGGSPPRVNTDTVLLAVPSAQAVRLAAGAGVGDAERWAGLGASPIVNVHVIYDRPVIDLPFVTAVDSPVQWVFDKTRIAGLKTGQYLAVSLSAADEFVTVPAAQLREQFIPELERLFPAAAQAQVTDYFVTRERRATFRQAPGCGVLRPGAATSVPGLVLAGSWTDTGWPDTMEGAVRSGHSAAQQLIGELAATTTRYGDTGDQDRTPSEVAS